MKNDFVELSCSPVRGGIIELFAEIGRDGILTDDIRFGVLGKSVGGIVFAGQSSRDFAPDKEKFKVKGIKEGEILYFTDSCIAVLKSKVGGLNTQISMELSPKSPILKFSCNLDNSGKKAKCKTITPALKMNYRSIGHKSSVMSLTAPSGKTVHFSKKAIFRLWEFTEEWVDYYGAIKAGKSAFFIVKRSDTGECLLVSFDPKNVSYPWMNRFSPLPHTRLIYRTMRIAKNKRANFGAFLVPMTDFAAADGYLIGYTRSKNGYYILAAGSRKRKIIASKNGKKINIKLEKISNALFGANIDFMPDFMIVPDTKMRLVFKKR